MGRPVGDVPGHMAAFASSTIPGANELPFEAAQSYREGNMGPLKSHFLKQLSEITGAPASAIATGMAKFAGVDVHKADPGWETRQGEPSLFRDKKQIDAEVREIEKSYKFLSPEDQQSAQEYVRKFYKDHNLQYQWKIPSLHQRGLPVGGMSRAVQERQQ